MQVKYANKLSRTHWDPVHLTYSVRKLPDHDSSSEHIARRWRSGPEIIKDVKRPIDQVKEYFRDYNITKELTKSQTKNDYNFKIPETKRFNKHTSCTENKYIYPPPRNLADKPANLHVHGTTEMKDVFTEPKIPARLVTDKDQFKHSACIPSNFPPIEPSWHKELEPLDTTYEGFEKYLDPYLTTNKLYHRPYTAHQLDKISCSNELATYYTFANIPWVRSPKPNIGNCRLPFSRPKSMLDREKFKQDFREIRTHNKLQFVAGTFHTESRNNYIEPTARPEQKIRNYEEEVRTFYERELSKLSTNMQEELSIIQKQYNTENNFYGSRKPVCSVLDQFEFKNERIRKKNSIG